MRDHNLLLHPLSVNPGQATFYLPYFTQTRHCPECFKKQNTTRIFSLAKKTLGLVSCGDIARYCHENGNLPPNANIYLHLSHRSLTGWTSQFWIPNVMISEWKKCSYVLVTRQVKNVSNYLKHKQYPYICPHGTDYNVKELTINGDRKGVIIDVDIH